jgi:hypothetical protein
MRDRSLIGAGLRARLPLAALHTLSALFLALGSVIPSSWAAGAPARADRQSQAANDRASARVVEVQKDGSLQISTPDGPVFAGVRLRLRLGDGSTVSGNLQPGTPQTGSDGAGAYEGVRYRLEITPELPDAADPLEAALELRRYARPQVLVALLDYKGPALAATDGVQVVARLESFARGLALKRMKLHWTAPVFTSDYRLLSRSNQLILWRQTDRDAYHVLAPLAGDGMIGEAGMEEYEFRVSLSTYAPGHAPRRVPLFAYASGADPYGLPADTYTAAFAAADPYGKLRWEKPFPDVFRWLGWCSWNTYYHQVTEQKVLNSVRSLRAQKVPVGFVLVDDGWLTIQNDKLAAYGADPTKFPRDIGGLARTLREEYHIPHVGIWHTLQGYWSGVDERSEIGRSHRLFAGLEGRHLPDPRDGLGARFYEDWYRFLRESGVDFVKVDNQSRNTRFTNGLLPLYASGAGAQRNLQEGALKFLADGAGASQKTPVVNVLNCMSMSLENVFNWRFSSVARNSDDYLPDNAQNAKEHVFQNAYNAFWTASFAYPDWDMFQTHDPNAEYHAIARAISGGPVYFTDEPGKERPDILRRLAFDDGRLLMLDGPGQVTPDLLLSDVALEPRALKVFGRVTRPGFSAGVVAAFDVNKTAAGVVGTLDAGDVVGLVDPAARDSVAVAVYRRSTGRATLLDSEKPSLRFELARFGVELYTVVPVAGGAAVFGLLDKYIGPAGVVSQRVQGNDLVVRLREAGDLGVWLERAPESVHVGGRALPASGFSWDGGLLRVPRASFGDGAGEHEVLVRLAPAR